MHDIGKTKIDPAIINKPARLTMAEYRLVQEHARYSYDILDQNWLMPARTKQGVLHHHENEDGTGYPDRLVGDEIPPYAKIIHVADVYAAVLPAVLGEKARKTYSSHSDVADKSYDKIQLRL